MWTYNQSSELYHHGTKGQKWGVRKYQYEDGSLTPEGKKRYNTEGSKNDNFTRASNSVKRTGMRITRGTGKIVSNVGSGVGKAVNKTGTGIGNITERVGRNMQTFSNRHMSANKKNSLIGKGQNLVLKGIRGIGKGTSASGKFVGSGLNTAGNATRQGTSSAGTAMRNTANRHLDEHNRYKK